MDQLPVNFGEKLKLSENGSIIRTELNSAMSKLVSFILEEGGFRFMRSSNKGPDYLTFVYKCCQDESQYESFSKGVRDKGKMKRFDCHSKLILRPCFENRTLTLIMGHNYHSPYQDIRLSREAEQFIDDRASSQTPSEIYRNLKIASITGAEHAVQTQIYYRWHQANKQYWLRHEDQFESARVLLEELDGDYSYLIFHMGNFRALAFYVNASISSLSEAKEIAIDATYGTNSEGMELCAVLAELDGVGVPLGYLLINKSIPSVMKTPKPGLEQRNQVPQIAETSAPGTMTEILSLFLEYLRSKGFDPSFVGCDKDLAEINALRQVWPSAKIQLCFWHAKRAIKKKLSDSSGADPLKQYRSNEALQLIPSLEICWGSYLSNRPNDNHRYIFYNPAL